MVIGSFGTNLVFQVGAQSALIPRSVKRESKGRYEEHKVLGSKPRLEYLAPELQTFAFSITLSAMFAVNPMQSLKLIRHLCMEGIAERLIIGGKNHGYYIIESASETWKHTLADGTLLSADVSVSLKEYVK